MDLNQLNEMQQLRQIEELKKNLLMKMLSKEAYERLARVRMANPEAASQAELYLLQVYQAGKLQETVTDDQMKEILRLLSSRKEINIKRK